MMMMAATGNYSASWIVGFFHSWPHISFSFTLLPKEDYSFDNNDYLESLVMIALMAVVWLVLTMTTIAIYFCCSRSKGKSEESTYNANGCYCSVCVFVVFLMLSLGCIGVALYGNMQAADGVNLTTVAVRSENNTFYALNTQVINLRDTNDNMRRYVTALKSFSPEDESISSVEGNLYNIDDALSDLVNSLNSVEDRIAWSISFLVVSENFRKISTFALLGFQCFLCFLGLLGICCRSKWMLIMMILLGMIGITASCFYLGADLMISVATADFCVNPYVSIYNLTVDKGYMSLEDANYFLKCTNLDERPYANEIKDGQEIAKKILKYIDWAENNNSTEQQKEVLSQFKTDVKEFSTTLTTLDHSLKCESTKHGLDDFIKSLCGTTLEGFFALAIAIFAMVICMSFFICATVVTARRYGKKMYSSDSLENLDYSDPFLPRTTHYSSGPRNAHVTRTNNPIYTNTTSSNTNYGVATNTLSFFRPGSDENISLLDHPPPYSPPRS